MKVNKQKYGNLELIARSTQVILFGLMAILLSSCERSSPNRTDQYKQDIIQDCEKYNGIFGGTVESCVDYQTKELESIIDDYREEIISRCIKGGRHLKAILRECVDVETIAFESLETLTIQHPKIVTNCSNKMQEVTGRKFKDVSYVLVETCTKQSIYAKEKKEF